MSDKSPDAFRTISEVADWLGVQPHVLRFWESKFSQVRPVKRAGGRRYYRPNDMLLLGGIRKLLHEDGLTIKGAQKVLREEGMSYVARMSQPLDPESAALSDLAAAMADRAHNAPSASPVKEAEPEQTAPESPTDLPDVGPGQVLHFDQAPDEPEEVSAPPEEPAVPFVHEEPVEQAPQPSVQPSGRETTLSEPDPVVEEPPALAVDDMPEEPPEPLEEPETSPEKSPLPSFMRSPARQRTEPAKNTEPTVAEPVEAEAEFPPAEPTSPEPTMSEPDPEPEIEPTASDKLPSFLQPPDRIEPEPDSAAEEPFEAELPFDLPHAPEMEPVEGPKPRIVDVPDPDESSFDLTAGPLSASFGATFVETTRKAQILPLVAQLAALRDRMAAGRGR